LTAGERNVAQTRTNIGRTFGATRMFDRLLNGGSLPALERTLQYTSARQDLIANNLANMETPGFRPQDVSPAEFQRTLTEALDARQKAADAGLGDARTFASDGGLALDGSDMIQVGIDGLELHAEPIGDGIMFHDGNDRNMERVLQSLTENLMTFRFAAMMTRRHFASVDMAIRERI
jgi:flagellar basal-body rod protein FlgB